jgi:hypothetical protein
MTTKTAAAATSSSDRAPEMVEIALPRKLPSRRLIINKDKRRQGFRNHPPSRSVMAPNKVLRRVFCMTQRAIGTDKRKSIELGRADWELKGLRSSSHFFIALPSLGKNIISAGIKIFSPQTI